MHQSRPAHDEHACDEYNRLTRRGFLAAAAPVAAAAAVAPAWLPRVAMASSYRSTQRDVIVSIYLRGGCDGLSMVPPHAEPNYYAHRPTLAVAPPSSSDPHRALSLGPLFGLSPALAPLVPAYNDGRLLIVHAAGLTRTSRSHFDAQRWMETAAIDNRTITGWLGRHLATVPPARPTAPLRGVGIAGALPTQLDGGPRTLPIPDMAYYDLTGPLYSRPDRFAAVRAMYEDQQDPLRANGLNTLEVIDLLKTINFVGYAPANGAVYPNTALGLALRAAAALIKADTGVEAVALDHFGWDTHNLQGSRLPGGEMWNLMADLASSLAAFDADLRAGASSYTLVAMSEFGRRLTENASLGTDHGHGNVMFLLGQCIQGARVLADWPTLAPDRLRDGIDLDITIDYRDVLGEILQTRLGNSNLAQVFPGHTPTFRGLYRC